MACMNHIGTHRTAIIDNAGIVTVQYCNTIVFTLDRVNHRLTLNDGGYRTHTTKTRINQALTVYGLNIRVFQRNFEWFVSYMDGLSMCEAKLENHKTVIALDTDNLNLDCINPNW